jgi:hypothetical protein
MVSFRAAVAPTSVQRLHRGRWVAPPVPCPRNSPLPSSLVGAHSERSRRAVVWRVTAGPGKQGRRHRSGYRGSDPPDPKTRPPPNNGERGGGSRLGKATNYSEAEAYTVPDVDATVVLLPRGHVRDVSFKGEVIGTSWRDPEHSAARAFLARGLTGPIQTTDARGRVRMRFPSVEKAGRLCVAEDARGGLYLRKWRLFTGGRLDEGGQKAEAVREDPSPTTENLGDTSGAGATSGRRSRRQRRAKASRDG